MNDESPLPLFTGGELALADTVILLMKVMSMHGIIDSAAIITVFADYLRRHTIDTDRETLVGSRSLLDESPGGSA
jgi:hypothetical protein